MVTQSRPTRGQTRVLEGLKQIQHPISAQSLYAELKQQGQPLG
jgi:Fe2+ or Zn2+ uptake regulation protein